MSFIAGTIFGLVFWPFAIGLVVRSHWLRYRGRWAFA